MSRFLKRFASFLMTTCLLLSLTQVAFADEGSEVSGSSIPSVGERITVEGDNNSPALTYSIISLGEGETNGTVALVQPISDNGQYPSTSPYTGTVTIPETIEYQGSTYTVVKILSYAFMSSSVTSVTIPSTVQEIGESAFLNCSSLSTVTFSDEPTLTKIGPSAFAYCSNLNTLSIPDSVTTIGTSAFATCGISSLTIPAGVTSGVGNALAGYDHSKVSFSSGSPYEIVENGLYNGTVLEVVLDNSITSFSIREGTTAIGEKAFSKRTAGSDDLNFKNLTSVSIPNSVTSIGDSAFEDCSALTSVTLPEGLTTIGKNAFARCSALTSLDLPKKLTSIGKAAFLATSLETVVIPNGITEIPEDAFSGISTLKTVVIHPNVTSIGKKAFDSLAKNNSDKVLIMQGLTAPSMENAFGTTGKGKKEKPVEPTGLTVVIPDGSESSYSGSILKVCITTESSDENLKPGISYKLDVNTTVSIVNGNTAEIGTAIVPTGWEFSVDPSTNNVVTISKPDTTTGAITATANSVGNVTVKISIENKTSGIVLAEQSCTITVTKKPSGGVVTPPVVDNSCKKDSTCPISKFTDSIPTAWYHDGVHYVLDKGLMVGIGDNKFAPNATLTRAELAQILYNKAGKPAVTKPSTFTDVPAGKWYADAIAWAEQNNVVYGVGGGKFAPDQTITREAIAAMMYRNENSPAVTGALNFKDATTVSDWALDAMLWATQNQVINGAQQSDGTLLLNSKTNATRAETATMLMNFCEKVEK
ncbi:MAG: leucine-rich repeat protein [Eubacteriales bacterium]|nr:leucine-rich repeat protein [Eubacteriales bacterium]